jgi:hypothetical protein
MFRAVKDALPLIQRGDMLFTGHVCTSTGELRHSFTICSLQRPKYIDVTELELVRSMRW